MNEPQTTTPAWPCDWDEARRENLLAHARLTPDQRFDIMMSFLELIEEGRRQLGVPPIGVTKSLADAASASGPTPPR